MSSQSSHESGCSSSGSNFSSGCGKESGCSSSSGSNSSSGFDNGNVVKVIMPTGKHMATVVWLHEIGDDGDSIARRLALMFPLRNVKFLCPTAPKRPVTRFDNTKHHAWFDIGDIKPGVTDDLDALDEGATLVANLLASEPPGVRLVIGGYSLGASLALYSAACYALERFNNGNPYPRIQLSAIVSLSGWLHGARRLDGICSAGKQRAASLPVFLGHGKADTILPYRLAEITNGNMTKAGFKNTELQGFMGLHHSVSEEEINQVCKFLKTRLELDGWLGYFPEVFA